MSVIDRRFVVILVEKVLPLVINGETEVVPIVGHVTRGCVGLELVIVRHRAIREVLGINLGPFDINKIGCYPTWEGNDVFPAAFHYPTLAGIKVIRF